jgi:DNA-binding XRE family transcriptional regulator
MSMVERAQKDMRAAMLDADVNQEAMAKMIGVAQSTVSKWLNKPDPGMRTAELMADAVGYEWQGRGSELCLVKRNT